MTMVVSEPGGAEIWIEHEKSELLTPALVQLPLGVESHLMLKMRGFETHEVWIRSHHELSFYFRNLERIKLQIVSDHFVSDPF